MTIFLLGRSLLEQVFRFVSFVMSFSDLANFFSHRAACLVDWNSSGTSSQGP
jgi:hypothetical protein